MEHQIEIYKSNKDNIEIQVQFDNETVWLTLNQIAALFDRDKSVISRHLKKFSKVKS